MRKATHHVASAKSYELNSAKLKIVVQLKLRQIYRYCSCENTSPKGICKVGKRRPNQICFTFNQIPCCYYSDRLSKKICARAAHLDWCLCTSAPRTDEKTHRICAEKCQNKTNDATYLFPILRPSRRSLSGPRLSFRLSSYL